MEDFCSFCRQLSSVVNIDGLELNDNHGVTLVSVVLSEVLPEIEDASKICDECMSTIVKFYQLKRDVSLGLYKFVDFEQEAEIIVKEEFRGLSPVREICASSESTPNDLETIAVETDSDEFSEVNIPRFKVEKSAAPVTTVELLDTSEDELLVETEDPVDIEPTKPTKRRKRIYSSTDSASEGTASNDPSTDSDSDDSSSEDSNDAVPPPRKKLSTIISPAERRSFKSKLEIGATDFCSICSKPQTSSTTAYRHMIINHSKNSELIKTWVLKKIDESNSMSGRRKSEKQQHLKCPACPRYLNSRPALRYHLLLHVTEGEIDDDEFDSAKKQRSKKAEKLKVKIEQPPEKIVRTSTLNLKELSKEDHLFIDLHCDASKMDDDSYKCVFCSHNINSHTFMVSHTDMVSHTVKFHLRANQELRHFRALREGKSWVNSKIDEIRKVSNASGSWKCCVCSKVSNSSQRLRYHLQIHLKKGW